MGTAVSSRWKYAIYLFAPMFLAAIAGVSVFVVTAEDKRAAPVISPDVSQSERVAHEEAVFRTAIAGRAQVIADLAASGIPVSEVQRASTNAAYGGPTLDLPATAATAVAIVRGTVIDQRVSAQRDDPTAGVVVSTLRVDRWLKSDAPTSETVELSQSGDPYRMDDGRFLLGIYDDDPPVDQSQEVIVFARGRDGDGRLLALPFKVMAVRNGVVEPHPADHLLDSVRGEPVDLFEGDIAALLAR